MSRNIVNGTKPQIMKGTIGMPLGESLCMATNTAAITTTKSVGSMNAHRKPILWSP